jgi:AcrR family transcriptional regulator
VSQFVDPPGTLLGVVAAGRVKNNTDDNRRKKQDQIIEAAKDVLAREGLAACTARSVADASPLTKSAIHYYFNDINEIIDRAVSGHVGAMIGALRKVAAEATDPRERLWRVVEVYLTRFVNEPHAAFIWFEYWISAARRESLTAAQQMLDEVRAFLVELISELSLAADADETAHAVLSWLLGTIVQQHVRPKTPDELRRELDRMLSE